MSHVKEQSADYQLADLSPVLKAADADNILSESLPIWLSAQTRKSAGRGRSADNTLQYGVQKLRELILELAVRGKLVSQAPNDEPASILLEKIAEEKAQLVKEGKIKKHKTLSEIEANEFISHLPMGWATARLGQLFHIVYGKGLSSKELENEGYDVFGANGIIGKYNRFNYQDKQLLISCRGAYSGKPNISPPNCFVTSNSLVLENKWNHLCLEYFYYSLTIADKSKIVTGSAQPQVTTTNLEPFIVGIPPLAEQHRIVKKVDELMALCDQLEQQKAEAVQAHDTLVKVLLDTLTQSESAEDFQQNWHRIAKHFNNLFTTESSIDQLKQTLLQLAVMGKLVPQDPNDESASVLLEKIAEEKAYLVKQGKIKKQKPLGQLTLEEHPFKLPSGWMWVHWNEILANDDAPFKRGPFGSALKKDMFVSSGYKVYEQYCPINDDCSYERYFITEEKFKSMEGFSVREDDYLVSCSGVTLGRITQVPKDFKEGIINQALLRVRINHKYVDKNFFKLLFRSPYFQKLIFDNSTGSAIPNVKGVKELKIMPVPLLPIAEQREIVAKFEVMMVMCDQLKDRLNQAQTLQQKLADTVINEALR